MSLPVPVGLPGSNRSLGEPRFRSWQAEMSTETKIAPKSQH